ncbi:anthranilate synthase component I family protein [Helicobacter aurati]|uniref:anthranilate synthase component I family protein n=1 Tax=Helicobacter aurati TaxID=137778 RepID=UPI001F2CD75E|nr:chorismate-binding protein [Helicobacter aurati]
MNLSYQKINVNMHTALTIYKGINAKFLLESATLQSTKGRYSIIVRESNFILSKEINNNKAHYFFKQKIRNMSHSQDSYKQNATSFQAFDLLKLKDYQSLPQILQKIQHQIESQASDVAVHNSYKLNFLKLAEMFRELHPVIPNELESIPIPLGGLGFLSYEFFNECERIEFNKPSLQDIVQAQSQSLHQDSKLQMQDNTESLPECLLVFPQECIIFDHFYDEAYIVVCVSNQSGLDSKQQVESLIAEIQSCTYQETHKVLATNYAQVTNVTNTSSDTTESHKALYSKIIYEDSKEWYQEHVAKITQEIYKGTFLQCVLSRAIVIASNMNPLYVYESLRRINPSPYMYYLDFDTFCIVGASPELMLRCKQGIQTLKPIAGTRKRGKTLQEDKCLEEELLNDSKENAEHLMLIDLARNDIGKNATIGSVELKSYKTIEKYSSVMHIVSEVSGQIGDNKTPNDCLMASFPAGTVSGAPKIEAIKKLESYENHKRGFYAGTIIYFERNGDLDSAITLRSTLYKDEKYYLQVGAGIVMDSTPESEYTETSNKIKTIYNILMQQ